MASGQIRGESPIGEETHRTLPLCNVTNRVAVLTIAQTVKKSLPRPEAVMIERTAVRPSVATNIQDSREQVNPASNGLRQVATAPSARARAPVSVKPHTNLFDDIRNQGGFKAATGYTPSLKSWISHKVSDVVNFFRGDQAISGLKDRNGNTSFRGLEAFAWDASRTAKSNSGAYYNVDVHLDAVVRLRNEFDEYNQRKLSPLPNGEEMLARLDSTIATLREEARRGREFSPFVEASTTVGNGKSEVAIRTALMDPSMVQANVADTAPLDSESNTASQPNSRSLGSSVSSKIEEGFDLSDSDTTSEASDADYGLLLDNLRQSVGHLDVEDGKRKTSTAEGHISEGKREVSSDMEADNSGSSGVGNFSSQSKALPESGEVEDGFDLSDTDTTSESNDTDFSLLLDSSLKFELEPQEFGDGVDTSNQSRSTKKEESHYLDYIEVMQVNGYAEKKEESHYLDYIEVLQVNGYADAKSSTQSGGMENANGNVRIESRNAPEKAVPTESDYIDYDYFRNASKQTPVDTQDSKAASKQSTDEIRISDGKKEIDPFIGSNNNVSQSSQGSVGKAAQSYATSVRDGKKEVDLSGTTAKSLSEFDQKMFQEADTFLRENGISISGATQEQTIRLADLLYTQPLKASMVAEFSRGDAKDLDLLLRLATEGSLSEFSDEECILARRNHITGSQQEGGLGIDPDKPLSESVLGMGEHGRVARYSYADSQGRLREFAGKVVTATSKNEVGMEVSSENGIVEALLKEEAYLARMPVHSNIVQSYGVHKVGDELVLLQELVTGGDLKQLFAELEFDNLPQAQKLTVVKHILGQVFKGLYELQKVGVTHLDVRASNLLIDAENFDIKLSDFGIARTRGQVIDSEDRFPRMFSGPENALQKQSRASVTVDTYFVSRILFGELVDRINLFNDSYIKGTLSPSMKKQFVEGLSQLKGLPEHLPQDLQDILNDIDSTGMLADFVEGISHPDPSKRFRAEQALQHPFLAIPPSDDELKAVFGPVFDRRNPQSDLGPPAETGFYSEVPAE